MFVDLGERKDVDKSLIWKQLNLRVSFKNAHFRLAVRRWLFVLLCLVSIFVWRLHKHTVDFFLFIIWEYYIYYNSAFVEKKRNVCLISFLRGIKIVSAISMYCILFTGKSSELNGSNSCANVWSLFKLGVSKPEMLYILGFWTKLN